MLFQSWRRGGLHELQDLLSEPPLYGGDTDERSSFLFVLLRMSVCSDVCVSVWLVLLQIWCVCDFKLCLHGRRQMLTVAVACDLLMPYMAIEQASSDNASAWSIMRVSTRCIVVIVMYLLLLLWYYWTMSICQNKKVLLYAPSAPFLYLFVFENKLWYELTSLVSYCFS